MGAWLGTICPIVVVHTYVVFFVRISFECDHQFNILTKFIVDQTQTPSLKVSWSSVVSLCCHKIWKLVISLFGRLEDFIDI